MPTYEYECEQCKRVFEYFQSVHEEPMTVCEVCGGKLRKLLSPGAGLIFKGSGFYITDYKKGAKTGDSGDKKPTSSANKTSKKDTEQSSGSSGDSKKKSDTTDTSNKSSGE